MKKIIGILGIVVIAATMFFSANEVNGSNSDISLTSLMTLNSANAECVVSTIPQLNTGRCSALTGNCYWSGGNPNNDCDPWAPIL